jgi:hypothetical protein
MVDEVSVSAAIRRLCADRAVVVDMARDAGVSDIGGDWALDAVLGGGRSSGAVAAVYRERLRVIDETLASLHASLLDAVLENRAKEGWRMSDFDSKLRETERAAAELRRLQTAAAELPELQAEQVRLQRLDRARAELDAAIDFARETREVYRDRLPGFRDAFADLLGQAQRVAAELRALQGDVPRAAAALASAIYSAQRAGLVVGNPAGVWCDLGWCDGSLAALPNRADGRVFRTRMVDEKLGELLGEIAELPIYHPIDGIRGAGVRA